MDKRYEFQQLLEGLCPNVYFQPPSNTTMKYPSIVYTRTNIETLKANNKRYKNHTVYNVTVIDRNPDSQIATSLLQQLDYCEFDRQFITDGLNHINFTIYY